jgi:ABC-type transport system substrate-binding protein
VAYTIDAIKDPASKSPLAGAWQDVSVTTDDANNAVIFELPRAYGPFIYNCDFGILPSSIPPDQFSKKLIGSGPYKFVNSKSKDSKITNISLAASENYYGERPHISKIELDLFKDKNDAESAFKTGDYNAISGTEPNDKDDVSDFSVTTQKRLGLIFNLRNAKLSDKAVRQSILGSEKLPEKLTLILTTLDSDLQREKAEEIKKDFFSRNIELIIKYLNPVEMKDVLDKKDYELLLYGFDFGHDRDPYAFWHSSQTSQSNFSGFSDKKADLILEDARMTLDPSARNALYDQFFEMVKTEAATVFYDPVKFPYYMSGKPKINGVSLNCSEEECRFDNVQNWFMKEKRVHKSVVSE